ncbi:folic acid binding / transferase [Wolffia australiana]
MKSLLACCKVYISESRNISSLESIERAVKIFPEVVIVNKFTDDAYNRVGYTLVSQLPMEEASTGSNPLKNAVFDMVKEALRTIDLQVQRGSHPRLGVVDHICFHPLSLASLNQVASVAKSVAINIGQNLEVPTYLYGAAHEEGRTLDSLRRELGYFRPNSQGKEWAGSLELEAQTVKPDVGPSKASKSTGVVVIGATKWVDNYNIPIQSTDLGPVKRISRLVSGRGGGLDSVQAMALAHGEKSTEVACNLLDPVKVNADQVQRRVEELAAREGLTAGKGYFTDFPQVEIIERYVEGVKEGA